MYSLSLFLLIFFLALLAYYLYLKQKAAYLEKLHQGICPKCDKKSIIIKREQGGGCSGVRLRIYSCTACGYEEEFSEKGGGCAL